MLLILHRAQNASAANTVIWKNHCDYDLYFWVVDLYTRERDDNHTRVSAGSEYIHHMVQTKLKDGGISLKYRDVPYYVRAPAGILQAEYYMNLNQGKVYYDSSIIDCGIGLGPQNPYYCPFAYGGVNMYVLGDRGENTFCVDSACQLGGDCDAVSYLKPGGWVGEPSLSCPLGVDLVFETCTEESPERTWTEGQVGPAPWQPPPHQVPSPLPLPPPAASWPPQHTPTTTWPQPHTATEAKATVTAPSARPSRPKTYPIPAGFPMRTVCFDADCRCYGFWAQGEPGRADCTGLEGIVECYFFNVCDTWQRTERMMRERQ
jgi:hypothetical protein